MQSHRQEATRVVVSIWSRGCEQTQIDAPHLVVDEGDSEDIGEEEDDFVLGVVARGCRSVGLYASYCLDLAYVASLLARERTTIITNRSCSARQYAEITHPPGYPHGGHLNINQLASRGSSLQDSYTYP